MGWYTVFTINVTLNEDFTEEDLAKWLSDMKTVRPLHYAMKETGVSMFDTDLGFGNLKVEKSNPKQLKITTTMKRGDKDDLFVIATITECVLQDKYREMTMKMDCVDTEEDNNDSHIPSEFKRVYSKKNVNFCSCTKFNSDYEYECPEIKKLDKNDNKKDEEKDDEEPFIGSYGFINFLKEKSNEFLTEFIDGEEPTRLGKICVKRAKEGYKNASGFWNKRLEITEKGQKQNIIDFLEKDIGFSKVEVDDEKWKVNW